MQQHWQMARQVGYYVVSMNQAKPIIKKPEDLFPLEIDEDKNKPIEYARVKRHGKH